MTYSFLPLEIYPREWKAYIHTKTCSQMFIPALFVRVRDGGNNQNVHQHMKAHISCGTSIQWKTITTNALLIWAMTTLKIIMLSEDWRKTIYCLILIFFLVWFYLGKILGNANYTDKNNTSCYPGMSRTRHE